jgi:hypothetical protein
MSEKALANKLRIALLDQIATVDLPGFLFEHLDQHLVELNYFKLSNLYNNVGRFTTYLKQVAKDYIVYVKKHNPQLPKSSTKQTIYEPFFNNALFNEGYIMHFSPTDLIKITSIFSVTCVLTMKEYIHRRVFKKPLATKTTATKKSST